MKAPSWYDAWRHEAVDQLQAKQDKIRDNLRTGQWPRYDYDLDRGQLIFSDAEGPKVRAEIQTIGSSGPNDWLWAWANASLPDQQLEDAERVRAFGVEHGIEELITDLIEDDDPNALGWELTAVAARILDAPGAYRPPGLFFVYRSIQRVS